MKLIIINDKHEIVTTILFESKYSYRLCSDDGKAIQLSDAPKEVKKDEDKESQKKTYKDYQDKYLALFNPDVLILINELIKIFEIKQGEHTCSFLMSLDNSIIKVSENHKNDFIAFLKNIISTSTNIITSANQGKELKRALLKSAVQSINTFIKSKSGNDERIDLNAIIGQSLSFSPEDYLKGIQ